METVYVLTLEGREYVFAGLNTMHASLAMTYRNLGGTLVLQPTGDVGRVGRVRLRLAHGEITLGEWRVLHVMRQPDHL